MVIGLAILSAACVFLLLYRHDISVLSSAQTLAPGPQFPQKPRNVTVDQKHAVQPQAAIQKLSPISPAGVAATEPLQFKIRRSRPYQTVGPVTLRLLRVNARRRTADVNIATKGRRTIQRRFELNRVVEIETVSQPLQLTISGIAKDSISGSLREANSNAQSDER